MRRVNVDYRKWDNVLKKMAHLVHKDVVFHEFGVDHEEFDCGPGNYSTAIVELDDGTVINVRVEDVQFLDKPE